MPKSIIITCAVTGGIHTPTMSKYLPWTPKEVALSAIQAANVGASVLHLHAREAANGRPDPRPETYLKFLPEIKQNCQSIVNITTGGGLGMTREERLRAAVMISPEMASLNLGSMNFGLFPLLNKFDNWKFDWEADFLANTRDFIFRNTFADIEYIVKTLGQEHGTRFEYECYDLGHLYNLAWVVDQGWIEPPFFVQLIFGVMGGMGADIENLFHAHQTAERLFGGSFEWSVLAAGRNQMKFATQAAIMGGNLRVGLEDSLYIGPGKLAESNAQQVEHIRNIIEGLGFNIATPKQVRKRLKLKGTDKVSF